MNQNKNTPNPLQVPLFDFPTIDAVKSLEPRFSIKVADNNVYSDNHVEDAQYDTVRQQIKLLEDHPAFYLAMYQPYQLSNISQTRGGQPVDEPMVSPAAVIQPMDPDVIHPKDFTYTVYSFVPRAGSSQLKQVFSLGPEPIVKHYTQLPIDESPTEEELKELNGEKKKLEARIKAELRGATYARLPGGVVYSWTTQERRGYEVAPTKFRQLRRRKGR